MAVLWYRIIEQGRRGLAKRYQKLAGYAFTPPREDGRDISVKGKIEDTEEIGRLMRQTRRSFKDD